jgi:signal transduction histidine kinase/ActR/RegA family two-component response regulator
MRNKLQVKQLEGSDRFQNRMYLDVNGDFVNSGKHLKGLTEQLIKDKEIAEERDKSKSAFLANMVHEICTPMNAIKGFAELLQAPGLPDDKKLKFSQIICQCSDNLLNLVHDLLDISKIEAGQITITERQGNLNDLFNELYELFDNPVSGCKSELVKLKSCMGIKPEQCLINADFTRLRQILINLIGNALKFTEQGFVNFGCCLIDKNTLCFYVEDTGIGICNEKKKLIFERFKQVHSPEQSRTKGTGLGLAIVKSLVELMNGRIWVESTPGIGSTFYFTLPFKKAADQKINNNQINTYNWNGKNILLVDDDDFDIAILSKYIEDSKAGCIIAKDFNSALTSIFSVMSIDMVLLNFQLQKNRGLELIQKIKSFAPYLPIIAISENYNSKNKETVLKLGCVNYISKRTNKKYLLQLIQNQFANKTIIVPELVQYIL